MKGVNKMKENIVKYEIKIFWNNGEEEVRNDVPFFKNVEDWLDAVEEDEREEENIKEQAQAHA